MKITFEHGGQKFLIDFDRAKELGLVELEKRFVQVGDIPNGSIFRYFNGELHEYVMINNSEQIKQCIRKDLKQEDRHFGRFVFFPINYNYNNNEYLEYWNADTQQWIRKI